MDLRAFSQGRKPVMRTETEEKTGLRSSEPSLEDTELLMVRREIISCGGGRRGKPRVQAWKEAIGEGTM